MDPFIGQLIMFAGNFAPRGWALCEGQLLPINQNQALFSILGTTYGGDGRTSFALPDLRGRLPLQPGTGPGLPTYRLGERGGSHTTNLTTANLPQSQIQISCSGDDATSDEPEGGVLALTENNTFAAAGTSSMKAGAIIGAANQAFSNQPPFLGVNYIIALVGVFPSRN